MKDLFKHVKTPTTNDIDLLKIGRHFRLDPNTKLVVGRNEKENEIIKSLALPGDILFETRDYVGPTSILRGNNFDKHVKFSAEITLRYSDSPKTEMNSVSVEKNGKKTDFSVYPAEESTYTKNRI